MGGCGGRQTIYTCAASADGTIVNDDGLEPLGLTGSRELMTEAFLAVGVEAWLSGVTVGALADLGYTVADPSPGAEGIRVDALFA